MATSDELVVMTRYAEHMDRAAAEARVTAFVMGPHVDPDLDDGQLKPAARLRKYLIEKLSEFGFAVEPTLQAVINITRGRFPADDLATVEYRWAKTMDLLIFIPSSPGSIAEVGYFAGADPASDERFARRSIILLKNSHEEQPGFVALGPAKYLSDHGAVLYYVDYADLDGIWGLVEERVDRARSDRARQDSWPMTAR